MMESIPVMGCDPHLDTITAAVIDRNGGELALMSVPNTETGWADLVGLCWTHEVRSVGIEGASGYGRRLAQTLTAEGIEVREMPTRLTASQRRVDGAGKTDPGDARTIGRATARGEGSTWIDDPTLETMRVISNRRDQLVQAQTSDINQLRALLAETDPETASRLPRIRSKRQLEALADLNYNRDIYRLTTARIIRDIARTCVARWEEINTLRRELEALMPPVGQEIISRIQGAGVVVTAQLLSEIAGTDGFATDAKMAAWAGVSPLDASSGRQQRHRLNRGGNRQVNRVIHTIIISQLLQEGEASQYVNRRMQEGKTRREAIRAVKRHAARRIWTILHNHELT